MSWQRKGWLLLTSALLATALVATTAGVGSAPSPGTAVRAGPFSAAAAAHPPSVDLKIIKAASPWYDG